MSEDPKKGEIPLSVVESLGPDDPSGSVRKAVSQERAEERGLPEALPPRTAFWAAFLRSGGVISFEVYGRLGADDRSALQAAGWVRLHEQAEAFAAAVIERLNVRREAAAPDPLDEACAAALREVSA